jgi:hypothetical protein
MVHSDVPSDVDCWIMVSGLQESCEPSTDSSQFSDQIDSSAQTTVAAGIPRQARGAFSDETNLITSSSQALTTSTKRTLPLLVNKVSFAVITPSGK